MAKPIKETPFLKGEDAKKFILSNDSVQRVSAEERTRIRSNYDALKSIAAF